MAQKEKQPTAERRRTQPVPPPPEAELHNPDDVHPQYYIEMVGFYGNLRHSLEEHGYTNIQVNTEAGQPDCHTINMCCGNNALDGPAVRQQLGQIISEIPATPRYHITWRVVQSVAVVQGTQVAAAIRVKSVLG